MKIVHNWYAIAGGAIVEGALVAAAFAHATPWATPIGFALGVLCPAFGLMRTESDG